SPTRAHADRDQAGDRADCDQPSREVPKLPAAGSHDSIRSVSVRPSALVVFGVDLDVLLPLVGQLILGEARVDRARLNARVAVDALLRVDVQLRLIVKPILVLGGVDAVNGAYLNAREILRSDARLGDHIGHPLALLASTANRHTCSVALQPRLKSS